MVGSPLPPFLAIHSLPRRGSVKQADTARVGFIYTLRLIRARVCMLHFFLSLHEFRDHSRREARAEALDTLGTYQRREEKAGAERRLRAVYTYTSVLVGRMKCNKGSILSSHVHFLLHYA